MGEGEKRVCGKRTYVEEDRMAGCGEKEGETLHLPVGTNTFMKRYTDRDYGRLRTESGRFMNVAGLL